MTDDPTPGELERSLSQFRSDVREDLKGLREAVREGLAGLNVRLDRVVSLDVYRADQRADDERYQRLSDDIADLRLKHAEAEKSRAANRRWLIAAVIIPMGVALMEIYFTAGGVK